MNKKALLIVANQDFRDVELLETKKLLEQYRIDVVVGARVRGSAQGINGAVIEASVSLESVKIPDFDAIVFIGGPGARDYFEDDHALWLAREFKSRNKVVAAICSAVSILANAGVLISKNATGFHTEEQNIKSRGGDYTGMPVEVDGAVVTGKDAAAAAEFGRRLAFVINYH